jgi:hypothetical protein
MLQTIIEDTFEKPDNGLPVFIRNLFKVDRTLVTFVRQHGKVLPYALHQSCTTRWNTSFYLLKSIYENKQALESWLPERDDEDKIALLEELAGCNSGGTDNLKYLINYVEYFCLIMDLLQSK